MKNIVIAISLMVSFHCFAQERINNANLFVRVYNLKDKKITKGKINALTDSTLQVINNDKMVEIPITTIGKIRTKRSAGHNVLLGAATGAGFFAILGAATANPDNFIFSYTPAEGAAAGAILGGISGAIVGGVSIAFKDANTYEINGEIQKWKTFKDLVLGVKR